VTRASLKSVNIIAYEWVLVYGITVEYVADGAYFLYLATGQRVIP
jgi:hypothetical protein